ncbi:hypothetical protein JDV09_18915 [Mycobacterium sp. Y57]|uniref:hypothetical protein n=1 Tax=Mycolicibacterium xanthum TaxID=2796469 RepID=UPI001C865E31|nr:hypothetical protein [Mycolicibacterium xanthum]MBX7434171.1 hypothetical protein [Mycolicibacterium xanthum]
MTRQQETTTEPGTEGNAAAASLPAADVDPGDPGQPEQQGATAAEAEGNAADGNSEAAKWRRQLRDAQTENKTLTGRVDGLLRREVERLAAQQLADPTDVWRDDVDLAGLLGEDGLPDPQKVDELIEAIIGRHPHWRRGNPAAPASTVSGDGNALRPPPGRAGPPSWQEVFKGQAADAD